MSNNQSKLYHKKFSANIRPRKLSLSTRIEIIKKRHLIKKAKKLLQNNKYTPTPASFKDDCNDTISVEILAEVLDDQRNKNRFSTVSLEDSDYESGTNSCLESETETETETETNTECIEINEKMKCLVSETPEIIEL